MANALTTTVLCQLSMQKKKGLLTNVSVYKQWDVKTSPEQYQHFLFLSYGNVYNCNVY